MKKYIITLLFCTLFCHLGIAQGLKSVSIYYFYFGATNDYWAKSPLGEYQYADWSKKIYILSALLWLICWIQ